MDYNEKIFLDGMREAIEEMDRMGFEEELCTEEEETLQEIIFEEELTREDCEKLMTKMDEFEKRAREKIMSEMRIYTCDQCSQEFLLSLIPKK